MGKASGERRSKEPKREKILTKTKQKGGREGACRLLTWHRVEGTRRAHGSRSPWQPAAPPSCTVVPDCTVFKTQKTQKTSNGRGREGARHLS